MPTSAWLAEVLALDFGRAAAKHPVARREPAEAVDHLRMVAREFGVPLIAQRGEPLDTQCLQVTILGVHQRHVEERATLRFELLLISAHEPEQRQLPREAVMRECCRLIAEDVARELIDRDHRRQQRIGRGAPARSYMLDDRLAHCAEALGDRFVERDRLHPMLLLTQLFEPEVQDARCGVVDFARLRS